MSITKLALSRRSAACTLLAAGLLKAPPVLAQDFPSRPIRLIIPYPPGGLTDVLARALQEPLRASLGQPVVMDNRGGAAGAIGMRELAHAPADGQTLVLTNNGPTSFVPLLQRDAGYDAVTSFTPVALLATQPLVILGAKNVPFADMAGLIDFARRNPGRLSFASAGIGSLGHLAGLLLNDAAGLGMAHIPYRGAAPSLTAVLSGEVQLAVTSYNSGVAEHARDGRLRVLGVTSPQPYPPLPDTPVVARTVSGYAAEAWYGLLGPARMPRPVVARLSDQIAAALARSEVQQHFAASGVQVQEGRPEPLRDRIAEEGPRWAATIRNAGITPE